MKRTQEDIEFANLLKANTPASSENPWFTRKVMNRLPEQSNGSFHLLSIVGYAICAILSVVCWVAYLFTSDFNVITISDILVFATMIALSTYLIFSGIRSIISNGNYL